MGVGRARSRPPSAPTVETTWTTGVWMSVWVDDVDEVHRLCVDSGLDITWPPNDMPWGVREMHVRHPDGHVFRVSHGLREDRFE